MLRCVTCLTLGAALSLFGAAPSAQAQVKEGQPAPHVELPATQIEKALPDKKGAKTLALKDLQGKKNVIVFFFPKALTRG